MLPRQKTTVFHNQESGGDGAAVEAPVVKTGEQIEAEIAAALAGEPISEESPESKPIDHIEEKPIVDKPVEKVIEKEIITPTGEFTPSPIWETIKTDYEKQIGENTFKMPEGISKENEHEILIEFLSKNIEPDISHLPKLAQELYKASQQEDFDENKFIEDYGKKKSLTKLGNEDFYRQHIKNVNEQTKAGWTDEDIEAHIENKRKDKIAFDAEVAGLKVQYDEFDNKNKETLAAQRKLDADKEFNTILDKRSKDITTLIERNKSTNDFYGVTFGEAELKEFHKWLPDMLTIDKESGSYPLLDYMRSDDNLMKIAAIVYKTEKGMRDYLSETKEGVKSDLLAKLRLTPRVDGGSIVTDSGAKPITGNEQG